MAAKLNSRDYILFAEALSGLVRAGVALPEALKKIAAESESRALTSALSELEREVSAGTPLPEALEKCPQGFPTLLVHLIRAGTHANDLHGALLEIAREYRSQQKMRDQLFAELIFPLATACIGMILATVLVFVLIPVFFEPIYASWRSDLPWPTRALFALSKFLRTSVNGPVTVLGAALLGYLLLRLWSGPGGTAWAHTLLLRLPVVGRFLRTSIVGALSRQLSLLLTRGIPLPAALELAEDCMWLQPARASIRAIRSQVEQGAALSIAMEKSEFIPATVVMLVRGAETHGDLPQTLKMIGEEQDEIQVIQSKQVIFLTFLFAQVVVASAVFFLLIAMFAPIFRIQDVLRRW